MLTFYFYDLETSGFNPREARVMQFAGQRTDMDLRPVEEPHNFLVRMTEDVVPDPDAVLITGITPQKTISEGLTEAEFLRIFHTEIARPETIFVGFNTVRFDDEFMRFMHYRNFYDPYEWQWQDGRSRFDLLDVARMTRALRPEGIKWPFDSSGKPANRLGLLASINKLEHLSAHDALSDVTATIALARLLKNKQPKLFDFLLTNRDKKKVSKVATIGQPFLYTSGKYDSQFEKTTAVAVISQHPKRQGVLVYDLRHDPEEFFKLDPAELATAWKLKWDEPGLRLPIKTLQFNRCPAIAPLSVLDKDSEKRLSLSRKTIDSNFKKLIANKKFKNNVLLALEMLDKAQQTRLLQDQIDVDTQLYDGFFGEEERTKMSLVRAAEPEELAGLEITFKDDRLRALLPLYKARNFPKILSDEDRITWERYRERKLLGGKAESRLNRYFARITELQARTDLTDQDKYLLEELQLYGQSIVPADIT